MSHADLARVPPLGQGQRGSGLSYAVLVSGLVVTALITMSFVRSVREKELLRLQNQASEVESRIAARLSRHQAALLGGAALFAVDERVNVSDFQHFTQRLIRFGALDGMQGMGFSRRVEAAHIRSYQYAVRREIPGFRVWPETERAEYHAIEFLEPQNWRNARAIGYDMFTDAARRDAMERARDSGEPAATGRVVLVQETPEHAQHGFVVYVPAYARGHMPATVEERRKNLVGFVYSPYRVADLLDLVLTATEKQRFTVGFYDGVVPAKSNALFEAVGHPKGRAVATSQIPVGGRHYTLQLNARPLQATTSRWGGIIVGAALGILITVLLFTITRFQYAARVAAEANAARLRQARAEAVRNLRTRDAFISIASHELKTPLTALQLQVDGLHKAFSSNSVNDGERVQRRLESVRRQARRLATLVDDLLDVSRLASGRLAINPEPVNLESLLKEVLPRFEIEAQRVGSPIVLHTKPGTISGVWDSSRLDQVITNLVSNALKYGAGHPINVFLEASEEHATIQVQDMGIGIAPEDQQRIFSRFERAVPDRNFGGFGLGLWICREIVAAMGGKISVQSAAGQGSTFTVTLPLYTEASTTAEHAAAAG